MAGKSAAQRRRGQMNQSDLVYGLILLCFLGNLFITLIIICETVEAAKREILEAIRERKAGDKPE
jgi:hypothetical protein